MKIQNLDKYGVTKEDLIIEEYAFNNHENKFKRGTEISIPKLNLSVRSHKVKSQKQNRDRCLRMLEVLLQNLEIIDK